MFGDYLHRVCHHNSRHARGVYFAYIALDAGGFLWLDLHSHQVVCAVAGAWSHCCARVADEGVSAEDARRDHHLRLRNRIDGVEETLHAGRDSNPGDFELLSDGASESEKLLVVVLRVGQDARVL